MSRRVPAPARREVTSCQSQEQAVGALVPAYGGSFRRRLALSEPVTAGPPCRMRLPGIAAAPSGAASARRRSHERRRRSQRTRGEAGCRPTACLGEGGSSRRPRGHDDGAGPRRAGVARPPGRARGDDALVADMRANRRRPSTPASATHRRHRHRYARASGRESRRGTWPLRAVGTLAPWPTRSPARRADEGGAHRRAVLRPGLDLRAQARRHPLHGDPRRRAACGCCRATT